MKILIIGRAGQVAWELQRELACLGEVIAVDRHSQPFAIDLLDNDSITQTINAITPQVIINAAAYTAVDLAEQEIAQAQQINGHALGVLAEAAKQCGALLIHYSTDYVFDGQAQTPYLENHPTAPQSIYGSSKLLGEQAIQSVGGDYLILRTAWVYGGRGKNFMLTMLRLMQEREQLNIVADQYGAPTWSRQIAAATGLILAQTLQQSPNKLPVASGIYHLACAGVTTWHGFASQIQQHALTTGILTRASVLNAIPTSAYPTPAQRPAYSVLSGAKLAADFKIQLPAWETALALCFSDYATGFNKP